MDLLVSDFDGQLYVTINGKEHEMNVLVFQNYIFHVESQTLVCICSSHLIQVPLATNESFSPATTFICILNVQIPSILRCPCGNAVISLEKNFIRKICMTYFSDEIWCETNFIVYFILLTEIIAIMYNKKNGNIFRFIFVRAVFYDTDTKCCTDFWETKQLCHADWPTPFKCHFCAYILSSYLRTLMRLKSFCVFFWLLVFAFFVLFLFLLVSVFFLPRSFFVFSLESFSVVGYRVQLSQILP